ncbi:MAG TPA: glycosyltransferase family 4 protein [Elusimicrobiota bacterium]|nr:glycosyltransferase family 4 protein [Elusimicrobiota bacterium]
MTPRTDKTPVIGLFAWTNTHSIRQVVFNLAHHLKTRGVTPVIITADILFDRQGPFTNVESGIRVYRIGCLPGPRWAIVPHVFLSIFQVPIIILRENISIAHIFTCGLEGCVTSILFFLWRVPYVITFLNLASFRPYRRRPLLLFVRYWMVARAHRCSVVSEYIRERALRWLKPDDKKIERIPLGIPAGLRSRPPAPSMKRDYVVSIANAMPVKGIDVLLYAFSLFIQKNPQSKIDLVVAGMVTGTRRLEDLIDLLGLGKRVQLVGETPHETAVDYMAHSLFYVQPSRNESFGLAVLEAMGLGKAVLVSNIGGLRDFCEHDKNAWLVEPQDAEALAVGIDRLAGDPSLRDRLGKEGQRTALTMTWDRLGPRYLSLYPSPLRGN